MQLSALLVLLPFFLNSVLASPPPSRSPSPARLNLDDKTKGINKVIDSTENYGPFHLHNNQGGQSNSGNRKASIGHLGKAGKTDDGQRGSWEEHPPAMAKEGGQGHNPAHGAATGKVPLKEQWSQGGTYSHAKDKMDAKGTDKFTVTTPASRKDEERGRSKDRGGSRSSSPSRSPSRPSHKRSLHLIAREAAAEAYADAYADAVDHFNHLSLFAERDLEPYMTLYERDAEPEPEPEPEPEVFASSSVYERDLYERDAEAEAEAEAGPLFEELYARGTEPIWAY